MGTVDGRAERGDATRAQIVDAAGELFSTRGYSEVGTKEVVRKAGVTRGAMYHHFREKRDLFRAVLEANQSRMLQTIVAGMDRSTDPWERIVQGIDVFFDECMDKSGVQIGLVDGPAVLGWDDWSELHAEYWLGLIETSLREAMDAGVLRRSDPGSLAHLLDGAFIKAALLVANSDDPVEARRRVRASLMLLIEGLRI
ncbi:MAG: TetR/AcrR family transcriptional regulator [Actinomycetota bacterium]